MRIVVLARWKAAPAVIRLSHARAADLLPLVQASLSERGRAVVDERTNSIIVRDVDCPAEP